MINDQNILQVQQISDAYVKVVKHSVNANMVCVWGMLDNDSKVIGTGFSMSNELKHEDLTSLMFYMQRNLFLNLIPKNE